MKLDAEHFEQVRHSNLLYQGGVVLAPGNYRLKFVARENESGKIGTFEQNLVRAGSAAGKSDAQLGAAIEPAGARREIIGGADQRRKACAQNLRVRRWKWKASELFPA